MPLYRSFLFAPGNHPSRVEKALTLDADAVILDLEDACPNAEKIATRALVVAACQRLRTGLGYVRVNAATTSSATAISSRWCSPASTASCCRRLKARETWTVDG